ncbi:hypothetical protein KC842_01050 [Candidatus Nomurabacteria bacterium]|nr:hypothetical protein [Candidatus Nomurabacteria bacterium]USN94838.1 MAG: hypothetical protein H6791_00175 [Candidatus Nomurabacteria bacterium]
MFYFILFFGSAIVLSIFLGKKIAMLRNEEIDIYDRDPIYFEAIDGTLASLRKSSVKTIKKGFQSFALFVAKMFILLSHKIKSEAQKRFPHIEKPKDLWEMIANFFMHNFTDYRVKVRKFKRHIKEKNEEKEEEEAYFEDQERI